MIPIIILVQTRKNIFAPEINVMNIITKIFLLMIIMIKCSNNEDNDNDTATPTISIMLIKIWSMMVIMIFK